MKVYKHDRYPHAILLALPFGEHIAGASYCYSEIDKRWVRSGIGTALPYYPQEKLDTMECLGETGKEWEFVHTDWFETSYLIDQRKGNGTTVQKTIWEH